MTEAVISRYRRRLKVIPLKPAFCLVLVTPAAADSKNVVYEIILCKSISFLYVTLFVILSRHQVALTGGVAAEIAVGRSRRSAEGDLARSDRTAH